MGATTYAVMAAHWPSAPGPFAEPMNEIPKVVFSHSLASADWGETTIAAGDLTEAITRLKQERSDGYLLAHGGARFARSLVETGLIDEYRLLNPCRAYVAPTRQRCGNTHRTQAGTTRQSRTSPQRLTRPGSPPCHPWWKPSACRRHWLARARRAFT
jgi:hypothetical protein